MDTKSAEKTFIRLAEELDLNVKNPSPKLITKYYKVKNAINKAIQELIILNMMIEE